MKVLVIISETDGAMDGLVRQLHAQHEVRKCVLSELDDYAAFVSDIQWADKVVNL